MKTETIKKNINLSKAVIPNSFTAFNALCGFFSIVQSSLGNYDWAFYFIVFASLFDLFDGILARLVNSTSEFGVELDSLSDMTSFGLAPAFLIYSAELYEFGWLGIVLSGLFLVFGAFRLARFNVQISDLSIKADFKGLPIPFAALTLSSFVWNFYNYNDGKILEPYGNFLIPLVILLSLLMVSTVRYNAFPKFTIKSVKEKPLFIGFVIVSAIVVIISHGDLLFYVFFVIVLFGIFRWFYSLFNKSNNEEILEETN